MKGDTVRDVECWFIMMNSSEICECDERMQNGGRYPMRDHVAS